MKPEPSRLTSGQVESIVKQLGLTCESELNCTECLQNVSEFAERQLANQPIDEAISKVEQHLALCPDCQEEYLALVKILKSTE